MISRRIACRHGFTALASEEGPVFYTKLGKPNPKIIDVVQEMSKSGD